MIVRLVRIAILGSAAAALLAALPAAAQTQQSFEVRAVVSAACQITAAEAIQVDVDPTSYALQASSGNLSVRCTKNTTGKITVSGGDSRTLTAGAATLPYRLCRDATCATTWGTYNYAATSRATTAVPIFAVVDMQEATIATGTDPAAGTYTETVTVDIAL